MTAELFRPSAPLYVQLELTEACNHACFFCYNGAPAGRESPLTTAELRSILEQLRSAGVFSVNFNGGEPLMRPDFFEIAEHARSLGFDLHLNTNGTLISEAVADRLAGIFPSACTSVLSSDAARHDARVGASGAFEKMRLGVERMLRRGMRVEINVCTFRGNYAELYDIAATMAAQGVHVFCVTRFIMVRPTDHEHLLGVPETLAVIEAMARIKRDFPTYREVKLPGPVPYCELPEPHASLLREWNTPCQVGYGLCRISPYGLVTPCPLSDYKIGSLREMSFEAIWKHERWERYRRLQHLPLACRGCAELESCRGGCVGYDDCLVACGRAPATLKWKTG